MTVLQINTQRQWRGGERQTYYITKALLEKGINVELLCMKDSFLYKKAANESIPVIGVNTDFEILRYLVLKGNRYDLIHCQNSKSQKLAVLTKPFHRRQIIFTRRVGFQPKGIFSRLKFRLTDRIIAISNEVKQSLIGPFPELTVDVIPDCVIKKDLSPRRAEGLKKELNIEGKKIVGTTSAVVPIKDPFTMLRAIKELSKKRNDFVFLHFGDGKLIQKLQQEIRKVGLGSIYILMGFHEDVEDFYSVFDVFVVSSILEGLCSSVLDAFVYKVPVVATEAGGLKEIVQGRGLLCPVKDYKCLAEAIERLLSDESLRAELTENAYQYVMEKFYLDAVINRYIQLYEELVLQPNP